MPQPNIGAAFQFKRVQTRTYDTRNDPNRILAEISEVLCPAGTLIPTLLATEPGEGWKLCNGQFLSMADYPRLFAIIGTQYGQTATDFRLPDLRGRSAFGAGDIGALGVLGGALAVTLAVDNLPAHSHAVSDPGHTHTFTADAHGHTITDPGHEHTAAASSPATAATGTDVATAVTSATSTDPTGITVDSATVTGTNAPATTSIAINETGGGAPVDITPPFVAVNWMVRT